MQAPTRALLMTDIVGSTALTRTLGDVAAAALWAAHDEAARALLPAWRGREIDKSDGMLLLFEHAADALGYVLAYLAALRSLPVQVHARAALHHGPVLLRSNPPQAVARGAKPLEVDGLAKPTAARVMALARGGQLLVTGAARDALGASPLPGRRWLDHGHWMFKGLEAPVALYGLVADGLLVEGPLAGSRPAAAPLADGFAEGRLAEDRWVERSRVPTVPAQQADGSAPQSMAALVDSDKAWQVTRRGDGWLPVREVPNNLPQPVSSFVGRASEQRGLVSRLAQDRLVTLLGMGGLGKTRLALQVAHAQRSAYPDGVWFVDLSPLREPELVAAELAQTLGLRDEPGRAPLQALKSHLASQRVLLVLDNCEHLVQAAADLVHALLRVAPGLSVLATSREALRVPGEVVVALAPLPLPAAGVADTDALAGSPAVALFVDRAAAHRAGFALVPDNAAVIAELVRRLEGIPLAIELAAARVRALSVADILARLRDRYRLLSGGARVLQPRQQTLRALVDWSYELLDDDERMLFDRLAVFAGGFDLEAAEQVCGEAPLDGAVVLDLLASLVEKSLVLADGGTHGTRYRLLDTLRDYAREQLQAKGAVDAVAQRHLQHYFALAKQINAGRQTAEQAQWLRRAEADADNLRAALDLPLHGGADPILAVKIAVAMLGVWLLRGRASEGRAAVRAALALPAVQALDMARAHGLYVGAALAGAQGDHAEALKALQDCLALRRGLQRPVDVAATLSTLALTRLQAGDAAAAERDEAEALALFRAAGDRIGQAISLLHLGQIALHDGRPDAARQALRDSLVLAAEVGHREVQAEAELTLGMVAWEDTQALSTADPMRAQAIAAAQVHIDASAAVCRDAADVRGEAMARWWQARLVLPPATANAAAGTAPAQAEAALPACAEALAAALADFRRFEMRAESIAALEDAAWLLACRARGGSTTDGWPPRAQASASGQAASATASAVDERTADGLLARQWAAAAEAARRQAGLPRAPAAQERWQRWNRAASACSPAEPLATAVAAAVARLGALRRLQG